MCKKTFEELQDEFDEQLKNLSPVEFRSPSNDLQIALNNIAMIDLKISYSEFSSDYNKELKELRKSIIENAKLYV